MAIRTGLRAIKPFLIFKLDAQVFSCAQTPKDCYKKGWISWRWGIAINEFDKIEA